VLGHAGTLQSDWSQFKRLTSLVLCYNRIRGAIPTKLAPNLERLNLNFNQLSGDEPHRQKNAPLKNPATPTPYRMSPAPYNDLQPASGDAAATLAAMARKRNRRTAAAACLARPGQAIEQHLWAMRACRGCSTAID
jgi:hypothetical protein